MKFEGMTCAGVFEHIVLSTSYNIILGCTSLRQCAALRGLHVAVVAVLVKARRADSALLQLCVVLAHIRIFVDTPMKP